MSVIKTSVSCSHPIIQCRNSPSPHPIPVLPSHKPPFKIHGQWRSYHSIKNTTKHRGTHVGDHTSLNDRSTPGPANTSLKQFNLPTSQAIPSGVTTLKAVVLASPPNEKLRCCTTAPLYPWQSCLILGKQGARHRFRFGSTHKHKRAADSPRE